MFTASLTIGIGGSGGVFAPSLFTGAMAGTAFGVIAGHLLGPAAGPPAIYGIIAMGAVFAAAAQAPLTSIASVVEMTGNYGLMLPVMLAVAVATGLAGQLSYGTIYTRKLLRRGIDIDLHRRPAQPGSRPRQSTAQPPPGQPGRRSANSEATRPDRPDTDPSASTNPLHPAIVAAAQVCLLPSGEARRNE
jgi:Voltage gated chloride channel